MHIILPILILIVGIYIYSICPDLTRKERMKAFHGVMFAHRGLHYKERGIPENSMAAFKLAIKEGYGIELDLHLTKDGKLIVFHDDTLERVCGRPERPEDLTLRQIRQCYLFHTSKRIPLFQDVLELVDGRVPLLIELKIPKNMPAICERTYDLLKDYHGSYLIQSFNPYGLHWFAKNAPAILRGQLSARLTKDDLETHYILRFLAEHLMANFYGKPDFISYKMKDLPLLSATIIRKFFGTTFAVWTLRSNFEIRRGKREFDIQIFEDPVNFINK